MKCLISADEPAPKVSGIVLAGGQGSRMGYLDKGLQPFHGKPMVAHVLERFAPQVDEILISANRNLDDYRRFGYPVVADRIGEFAGPLAGLDSSLGQVIHTLVALVPCDSPFLPLDLVDRLAGALAAHSAQLVVAKTFDRPQPVFCVCYASLAPQLRKFLIAGGRKIGEWHATLKITEVNFDGEETAFANINTPEELAYLEARNKE